MSRPPVLRLHDEIAVDNFAGGGGASLGIRWAIGRDPDIAINHDPEAIAMHTANHPSTQHLCEDVWAVDPVEVCGGRRVGLAWFSPDCTHHSKAKGGKPRSKKLRALAWVVVRWARAVKPRVIILENVEEFADWGPLDNEGQPVAAKRGLTFRIWLGKLKAAGYDVEMRELRACDFGAPTTRKRLFIIARCDGRPIVWPDATHGPRRPLPYRTAAECIDWSLPCPSIFGRKKELAEKTLARIARGIMKYVVDSPEPFVIPLTHAGDLRTHSIREPFRTITAANRGELALITPTLIQTGYGERVGQSPRSLDIREPLGTVVAGGAKHALVACFLARHYGGHENSGGSLAHPMSTITTKDHHALVTAQLAPPRTDTVRAFLTKFYGTNVGQQVQLPLGTITAGGQKFGLVYVAGEPHEISDIGMRMLAPRELFRAQGFDDSYLIDPVFKGKPLTKTAQIHMGGNSVSPVMSRALVSSNLFGSAIVAA